MTRNFTDITNETASDHKSAVRALQAWQFLIAKASNRQTIRYEHLSTMMGYTFNPPLFPILAHVMELCSQWGLPPLTVIVVSSDGTPGAGFTEVPRAEFDARREAVFEYPWFTILPPTIDEFGTAHANAH